MGCHSFDQQEYFNFRFGQMNDLVIIQTTQGLAQYLLSETNPTIPVSFDLLQNVEMTDSINYNRRT